jgi:tetratricopeptide (TPR) repeat protein
MTVKSLEQIVNRSAAKTLHRRALAWLFAATAASASVCECKLSLAQEVSYGSSPNAPVIMQGVGPQNSNWTNVPVQKSTLPTSPWQESPRSKQAATVQPTGDTNAGRARVIRQPNRRVETASPALSVPNNIAAPSKNEPSILLQPSVEQSTPETPANVETLPAPSQSDEYIDFGPVANNARNKPSKLITAAQPSISPIEKEWQGLPPTGMVLASDADSQSGRSTHEMTSAGLRILPPQNTLGKTTSPIMGSVISSTENSSGTAGSREKLAAQISREIMVNANMPAAESPKQLESPPGWQALETDLRFRLKRCDELLRRGATRSGRQEAVAAIRSLLRALDLRRGDWISEPAFDAAMTALKEERHFSLPITSIGQAPSTAAIVEGHQTPVLKNTSLDGVSPELASQYYRAYARDRLTVAADDHEWAADVYYALGKTFEKQASEEPSQSVLLRGQAVVCYQAALSVTPSHADAATQLSYVLLQLDRSSEAEEVLAASLELRNSPHDWRNLVEVYRRQGNETGQQWALEQLAIAQQISGPTMSNIPRIQQISPTEFVQISPYMDIRQTTAPAVASGNTAVAAVASAVNGQPANTANQPLGWANKIFR